MLYSLLLKIQELECINKQKPSNVTHNKLSQARHELRQLLLSQFDCHMRTLKLNNYYHGNRPGKHLANQVKEKISKQKIPFLKHPTTCSTLQNQQDIADAFSTYFSNVYNLGKDTSTPQPTPKGIAEFLDSISLTALSPHSLNLGKTWSFHKTLDRYPC